MNKDTKTHKGQAPSPLLWLHLMTSPKVFQDGEGGWLYLGDADQHDLSQVVKVSVHSESC